MKTDVHTKSCLQVSGADLFIITKIGNNPKVLQLINGEQIGVHSQWISNQKIQEQMTGGHNILDESQRCGAD